MIAGARHQPNAYSCGPSALRHALLAHGHRIAFRRVAGLAGTSPEGTDEKGLARAAEALGFRLGHVLAHSPAETYAALREAHGPVLLCVDHYSHWIVVVRATSRHVEIVDSARGGALFQRLTWRELCRRLAYGLPDEMRFDLYPVIAA